ncbi:TBC1 domain family member 2B [Protobothrops mucrosquamatus]|uniref:TBC1 domain family member 2B n=1 Tax=Protobothrops mucrosquamatus TaxID=103944 RepID=UPI000775CE2A|nr:TBC1 domain family member 2B [Protobothrops mucrosquamatus]
MPAEEEAAGGPRLCGYLQKLSGKGPLRAFRSRWFAFDARRCALCYYKGPREAQPLGRLELAGAAFRIHDPPAPGPGPGQQPQPAEEERRAEENGAPGTAFEVRGPGGDVAVLRAATHQDMMYWLQELQQKRWEYCHSLDAAKRYSRTSPTPAGCSRGLVAKDSPDCTVLPANASAENARNILAVEIAPTELVGEQAACLPAPGHPGPINFSLRQLGTEIRNSVSSLRTGKGSGENRRSVFYTEEWEMLDPTPKDLQESAAQEEKRRLAAETSKGGTGSSFPFDFGRLPHKARRPLKDSMAASKGRGSQEAPPREWSRGQPAAEMQLKLQSQQEDLEQLKTELASQKELVRLLQQTVRSSQYDRYLAGPLCDGSAKGHLELLHQKDRQIWGLNHQLEKLNLDKEHLQQEVASLKSTLGELGEQLDMLMETIQAKDEVIMKLSRELSECESSWQSGAPPADASPPLSKEQQELSKLKDSLQGYKTQNKFLNKEILELSALRRNAENREKELMAKHTSLEAQMCQVESRYLVLLQERKTPVCSEEPNPDSNLVAQLLEDALKVDSGELPAQAYFKPHMVSEYDVYGFQTVPEDEEEEERLVAKVRALDLKSLSLTEHQEMSTGVKWENFLAATVNREMVRSVELKSLIRGGVPHEHRCQIWKWCVGLHVKKFKESSPPGYFQSLLQNALKKQNPASKQIELDLLRTLPNNKHYSSPASEGIQKLRNVLLAFSWRNPDIGYCQGLNRLAAIALLYLEQEDAFWCLVTIVEVFMPRDYYTKTLLGSQVDQRVFKDLMNEKLPRLHTHFEQHRVDFSLITFNWFLIVFVDSVVSDVLFKIWDSFLYEGPKVIFRFALALFKYKEEEILKLLDSTSIFKYLRSFTRTVLDARKLTGIAFRDLNPFPLRQIRNRRAVHLEKVRLELLELEAMREDFLRERETHPEKRDLISEDEEDG